MSFFNLEGHCCIYIYVQQFVFQMYCIYVMSLDLMCVHFG